MSVTTKTEKSTMKKEDELKDILDSFCAPEEWRTEDIKETILKIMEWHNAWKNQD